MEPLFKEQRKQRVKKAMQALRTWMYAYEVRGEVIFEIDGFKVTTNYDYEGPEGQYRASVRGEKTEYLNCDKE